MLFLFPHLSVLQRFRALVLQRVVHPGAQACRLLLLLLQLLLQAADLVVQVQDLVHLALGVRLQLRPDALRLLRGDPGLLLQVGVGRLERGVPGTERLGF